MAEGGLWTIHDRTALAQPAQTSTPRTTEPSSSEWSRRAHARVESSEQQQQQQQQ